MKHTLLLLCLGTLLSTFHGCMDECETIDCNTGTCNDGICECDERHEGDQCEKEKVPMSITIEKINVLDFPNFTEEGDTYDEDGSGADLALLITDQDGNSIYKSTTVYEDADFSKSYNFDVDLRISDYHQNYLVALIDEDEVLFDFVGGGVTTFWNLVEGESFPLTDTMDRQNVHMRLDLDYTFK